jgi:hypothetical protein
MGVMRAVKVVLLFADVHILHPLIPPSIALSLSGWLLRYCPLERATILLDQGITMSWRTEYAASADAIVRSRSEFRGGDNPPFAQK